MVKKAATMEASKLPVMTYLKSLGPDLVGMPLKEVQPLVLTQSRARPSNGISEAGITLLQAIALKQEVEELGGLDTVHSAFGLVEQLTRRYGEPTQIRKALDGLKSLIETR